MRRKLAWLLVCCLMISTLSSTAFAAALGGAILPEESELMEAAASPSVVFNTGDGRSDEPYPGSAFVDKKYEYREGPGDLDVTYYLDKDYITSNTDALANKLYTEILVPTGVVKAQFTDQQQEVQTIWASPEGYITMDMMVIDPMGKVIDTPQNEITYTFFNKDDQQIGQPEQVTITAVYQEIVIDQVKFNTGRGQDNPYPNAPDSNAFLEQKWSYSEGDNTVTYYLDKTFIEDHKTELAKFIYTQYAAPKGAVKANLEEDPQAEFTVSNGYITLDTRIISKDGAVLDTPVWENTLIWKDAEGKQVGETDLLTIKALYSCEYSLLLPFEDGQVKVTLNGWKGATQPFTLTRDDAGDFEIFFHMTQADWQEAYNNHPTGEDGLFLSCSYVAPKGAVKYGITSTGDIISQGRTNIIEPLFLGTNPGAVFREIPKQGRFDESGVKIASFVKNGSHVTINPEPTGRQMRMKIVSWRDKDFKSVDIASGEKHTYCQYLRFRVVFDDANPVVVETENYQIDGRRITTNLKGEVAEKYFYDQRETTFLDNCVSYYLDGVELRRDKDAQIVTPEYIMTAIAAPADAVSYKLHGIPYEFEDPSYHYVPLRCDFYFQAQGMTQPDFQNIAMSSYQIEWVRADDSTYSESPIGIRVTCVKSENELTKHGWEPLTLDRVEFSEQFNGNNGLKVVATIDDSFKTEFTGDPIDIGELYENDAYIKIKVPEFGGVKPTKYSYSGGSGQNKYSDYAGLYSKFITIPDEDKLPLNGVDSVIAEYYDALPAIKKLVDNGVTTQILTRPSVGDNEDCCAILHVHWFDDAGKELGVEFIQIEVADCFEKKVYEGQADVTAALDHPVLISDELSLQVKKYIISTNDTSRQYQYMNLTAVDARGFEAVGDAATVYLNYPSGVNSGNFADSSVVLRHYTDESFAVKETVELTAEAYGMKMELQHFSPFLLSWKETQTPTPSPTPSDDNGGRSASSVVVETPDPAVTPIIVAADGSQVQGTSVISVPIAKMSAKDKESYVEKGQWTKDAYGRWSLVNGKGETLKSCWALVSDALSSKSVGNASWYYFDANGKMLTGWQWIPAADGKLYCYYFNKEAGSMYGACLMGGTTKDGYLLNAKGRWVDANGKEQTK